AALAGVTVAGTVVDSAKNGVDAIDLTVTAGKNVQTVTLNTADDVNLSVDNQEGSDKAVTTIDASASAGDISFIGGEDVSAITTCAGYDEVTHANEFETTVKTASVSSGAGDDVITFATTSAGSVTVDAGEGNDTITVERAGTGDLTIN